MSMYLSGDGSGVGVGGYRLHLHDQGTIQRLQQLEGVVN